MRISRLAAGRKILINVDIDYVKGSLHADFADAQEKQGCSGGDNSLNARLLQALFKANLPEYGTLDLIDEGLSEAGQEAKQEERSPTEPFRADPTLSPLGKPKKNIPNQSGQTVQPVQEEPQLDTGFNV